MEKTIKSILIADDTTENLHLLADFLIDEGYQIRTVTSGALAIKAVETAIPDLILLDIRMPGIDGYEVCKQLKKNDVTKNIPIIFLSGLIDPNEKEKAYQLGGDDYLSKPFDSNELIIKVKNLINLSITRKSIEKLQLEIVKLTNKITELEKA
ncbi:MAG: hypothetical protein A2015_16035 [Spirochaetes bacterium GWF1_31_7]|nr:MAG: hypothetical protein A2Y30_13410 [Spirochaetes bacterium GWE1_32_154]OHD49964.1 MAG: hypothetical protein A2Y29_11455 [Spirochaetes bacterium GWE2_31_10]OHD52281.1 MAG: hypothetical protein A2015_16035 [Spirochaetes bacterium GWF1_31_7]OHD72980.1 MAG: hypothetical protein A2355_07040 [Spirochaetes bacterium RIFOXYB1_FULL_32_8]HBD96444.1 hypothetical protein [Spirochaetia bacterium]